MKVDIFYNVNVLKQDENIPLSLQVKGFYGLINVTSDYLNANALLKRGTGFFFRTKKGAVLSTSLKVLLNRELKWKLSPAVSLTISSATFSR